nr:hypothetical protein [Tanacetum cinerariifolium]
AQLVGIDTESEPEEAPSEEDESQPLGPIVPLMGEEFKASELSGTRTISSYSSSPSDSTPLSPVHPLIQALPTPTHTQASFHHRTACMTVRTQPTMSTGLSASVTEAMTLLELAQLVGIDTESEPEEAPSEEDESQPLGPIVPLMGEEFKASELSVAIQQMKEMMFDERGWSK